MAAEAIEKAVLQTLAQAEAGGLPDTGDFAAKHGFDHLAVVGVMKSLLAADMIAAKVCVCEGGAGGRRLPPLHSRALGRRQPTHAHALYKTQQKT